MELEEPDIISVLRQHESRMMSIFFSGWWKPLPNQRLEEGGRAGSRQRRALLRRSGCQAAYEVIATVRKELAYLDQFGQPLLPFQRERMVSFCIRHPDLQPRNIIVSTSSDSNQLKIVGLLDWQHARSYPSLII